MPDVRPTPAQSPARDINDHRRFRHGRERDVGFPVGRYLQPPPLLFTRDGHNVFLGDLYRGHAAFLVCGGPSLTSHDLSLLRQRGILTLAVNNAATVVRPTLWTSVDDPGHFCDAIWYDPGILKFVPLDHMEKTFLVRDRDEKLVPSRDVVGDMPGVFGFRRNESFRVEQWLHESTFNWGNHSDRVDAYGNKGSRSIFYVALRLLYFLGVRTVYLLGCDFRMEPGRQNYAFEQDRSPGSIRSNNSSYRILNARLERLKPYFDAEGFRVFNCTPGSGLTVFPALDYQEAVRRARAAVPERIKTSGMYDFKTPAKVKTAAPVPPAPAHPAAAPAGVELAVPIPPTPGTVAIPKEPGRTDSPVTLLVHATAESVGPLRESWRTWESHFNWIRRAPAIVCLGRDLDPRDPRLEWLRPRPNTRLECGPDDGASSDARSGQPVWTAARHADRPWLLCLSPTVAANAGGAGLDPAWFGPRTGSDLAYVAPRRTTRPTPARVQGLKEWARTCPTLSSSAEPAAGAFTLDGAVFLVRTEWFRGLAPLLAGAPPGVPAGDVLGYLAARRGDRGLRVNFREYGWEEQRGTPTAPHAAGVNGNGKRGGP